VSDKCCHCQGTGVEPTGICPDCGGVTDHDGYCDPCAEKAVAAADAQFRREHNGRTMAEEFVLRRTERSEATAAALDSLRVLARGWDVVESQRALAALKRLERAAHPEDRGEGTT
jgi:hypothetical protein